MNKNRDIFKISKQLMMVTQITSECNGRGGGGGWGGGRGGGGGSGGGNKIASITVIKRLIDR